MLDIERSYVNPVIESLLAHLVPSEDGLHTLPTSTQESLKETTSFGRIGMVATTGDACGAGGTKTSLARPHPDTQLPPKIVEVRIGLGIECIAECGFGDQLALTQQPLVEAGLLSLRQTVGHLVNGVMRLRNRLFSSAAGSLFTELIAHRIDDVLGHEPVGG